MIQIEKVEIGPRTNKLIGTWTVEIADIHECIDIDYLLDMEDKRIMRNVMRAVRKSSNKRKKQKRAYCK